jgi:predicted AAA+ superfamily ATPase
LNLKKIKMEKKSKNKFAINAYDKTVGIVNTKDTELHDEPIPGFYKTVVKHSMMSASIHIQQTEVNIPKSAHATTKHILDVDEVLHFLGDDSRRIHNAMGIPAKYGIILYGKQGTGKTTAMLACASKFVEQYGAIAIIVDSKDDINAAYGFIHQCQSIKKDQMFVLVHDECEHVMKDFESTMKARLDGADTPNNLIYIGTTNYIDKIPKTILDRPSRIKKSVDCSELNEQEDIVFNIFKEMNASLEKKDKLDREELIKLCPENKGKTIDELKHIFLQVTLERKFQMKEDTKKVTKRTKKKEKVEEPAEME